MSSFQIIESTRTVTEYPKCLYKGEFYTVADDPGHEEQLPSWSLKAPAWAIGTAPTFKPFAQAIAEEPAVEAEEAGDDEPKRGPGRPRKVAA